MGSLFGFLLFKAGKDVWLLENNSELAKHINDNGLCVEGLSGKDRISIPITTNVDEIKWGDIIIIFVKAYDTAKAIWGAKPLVGRNSVVITLQNGIGNVETIAKAVEKKAIIAGTTAQGATLLGPGHVLHAGRGETIIGELNAKKTERLNKIRNFLESAGISTQITTDVTGPLWSKLLINAGINSLTGITGLHNGELLDFEETREVMHKTVDEAMKIVSQKDIRLVYESPREKIDSVCRSTARNISSLLQDLSKNKKTEIDFINGAIVREGSAAGISTPINQALTHLIHFKEKN